jgi:hypothetical protein
VDEASDYFVVDLSLMLSSANVSTKLWIAVLRVKVKELLLHNVKGK